MTILWIAVGIAAALDALIALSMHRAARHPQQDAAGRGMYGGWSMIIFILTAVVLVLLALSILFAMWTPAAMAGVIAILPIAAMLKLWFRWP